VGTHVGDIREPNLVGTVGGEVAFDQIVMGVCLGGTLLTKGPLSTSPGDPTLAMLTHYVHDPLAGCKHTFCLESHEDLGRTVYTHTGLVPLTNELDQLDVT
jgi:hypothetical protein